MLNPFFPRSFGFGRKTPTPPPPFYGAYLYLPGDGAGSIAKTASFVSPQLDAATSFGIAVKMMPRNYIANYYTYPPEHPEGLDIGPLTNTWRSFPGGTNQGLISKGNGNGNLGFSFSVNYSGSIRMIGSTNGIAANDKNGLGFQYAVNYSAGGSPIPDNAPYWIGATMEMWSGGKTRWYSSPDGITWNVAGYTLNNSYGPDLFDSNAPLRIGSWWQSDTANNTLSANIYRIKIFDSGVLVGLPLIDFDPSLYVSGSSFTSTTGEVWTLAGNATIVTS